MFILQGNFVRQYIIVVIASFTFFQIGANIGVLSPTAVKVQDPEQDILSAPLTNDQVAWFMSVNALVCIFTFLYSGYLTDTIGRKYAMIVASVPRLATCVFYLVTTDYWMLIVARCFSGLSDLFAISVTATYNSEIANKEIRGGLGTVAQILSALGTMMFLVSAPFMSFMATNIMLTVATVVTFVPLLFLPETPYHLYSKGKKEQALDALTTLRGSSELAHEEIDEYATNSKVVDKREILKDKIVLKTIVKVFFLSIGSQFTGYNAVIMYIQVIFETTQTTLRSEVTTAITGCVQLLACICTIFLTDRFGRKPVLIISTSCMGIGLVGLGAFFLLVEEGETSNFLNYLPLLSIAVIIYSYNAGMGSLLWTVIAELFDGPSRAVGVSFGVLVATASSFLTIRFLTQLLDSIGPVITYWTFGACCFALSIFIGVLIPETKGKTFLEIQKEMGRDMKS